MTLEVFFQIQHGSYSICYFRPLKMGVMLDVFLRFCQRAYSFHKALYGELLHKTNISQSRKPD